MKDVGTISIGIRMPIIKEGDDLGETVVNGVLNATFVETNYVSVAASETKSGWEVEKRKQYDLEDRDVIGITESVVARSIGKYVTLDEIGRWLVERYGEKKDYILVDPIYSRNRFSMILKAIARVAGTVRIIMPEYDEVGNPRGVNPFTGVDIGKYYNEIVVQEGARCECCTYVVYELPVSKDGCVVIYCGLHDYKSHKAMYGDVCENYLTLADICSDRCEYGLLGSNKATEEKLKLFPDKGDCEGLLSYVQTEIMNRTGKKVEVMVYGDGCFKDPVGGIWEFADPVVSPAYTSGLEGTPNEIKIKAFADDKFKDLSGNKLNDAIKCEIRNKGKNLVGNMASQGTTPRRYTDLLGSLMDLTSGSGDKGCPVVLVKNYFKNYADE